MTTPLHDDGPGPPPRPAGTADTRTWVMLGSGLVAVVLVCVVSLLPLPYVLLSPGPVRDVLGTTSGQEDGDPMITITGTQTYPTEGSLDLLTVSVSGGPGSSARLWSVVEGWVRPSVAVRPLDEQYPPDRSEQEIDEENAVSMTNSQESATAAALSELGVDYGTTLTVAGFAGGTDAEEALRAGDALTSLDGQDVLDLPQLRDALQQAGAGRTVEIGVTREGVATTAEVTTGTGSDGSVVLGVLLTPSYRFPFDVQIEIEDIGGPSAGMMFALGIVDELTPGPMTGGEAVAGTGTIDAAGQVGPIGGIRQKLYGARDAGAGWFLAPAGNCDEVAGHVPDGLRVVRVASLQEARAAVEAIGTDPTSAQVRGLATCPG